MSASDDRELDTLTGEETRREGLKVQVSGFQDRGQAHIAGSFGKRGHSLALSYYVDGKCEQVLTVRVAAGLGVLRWRTEPGGDVHIWRTRGDPPSIQSTEKLAD